MSESPAVDIRLALGWPPDRSLVQPDHLEALEQCEPGPATHMLTGPVHVEGAEPGDVLQIDLLDIALADRWGFTAIRPLRGTLPDEFDRGAIIHPEIDIQRRTARRHGIRSIRWRSFGLPSRQAARSMLHSPYWITSGAGAKTVRTSRP